MSYERIVTAPPSESTAPVLKRRALTPSTHCSLRLLCRRMAALKHELSLRGSAQSRKRAPWTEEAHRKEEAYWKEIEAAQDLGTYEEHMAKRRRAAADDQPLNAGQSASQLNDARANNAEAVEGQAMPSIMALHRLGREASQHDEQAPARRARNAGQRAMYEKQFAVEVAAAQESEDRRQRARAPRRERNLVEFRKNLREEAEKRVTPVSVDRLVTRQWLEMKSAARMTVDIADNLMVTTSLAVPGYNWGDSGERAQSERHIQHLKTILGPCSGETEWVDAAKEYPELLSCTALGYKITATADVLAADSSAVRAGEPQKGMRLLMDIRQAITASHVCQAHARLLLANIHCPASRPVQVVTDLNDKWHAMWLDGSTIYQHPFESRGRAVGFIQDLLAGRHETCEETRQLGFAKRRQISPRVLEDCDRNAEFLREVEALGKQAHAAFLQRAEALRKQAESSSHAAPTDDMTLDEAMASFYALPEPAQSQCTPPRAL